MRKRENFFLSHVLIFVRERMPRDLFFFIKLMIFFRKF